MHFVATARPAQLHISLVVLYLHTDDPVLHSKHTLGHRDMAASRCSNVTTWNCVPRYRVRSAGHGLKLLVEVNSEREEGRGLPNSPEFVQILCFSTFSIVLSLSKNTVLFIFQNTTFRSLDSVSVFSSGDGD
jgi:hypothetical protein